MQKEWFVKVQRKNKYAWENVIPLLLFYVFFQMNDSSALLENISVDGRLFVEDNGCLCEYLRGKSMQ